MLPMSKLGCHTAGVVRPVLVAGLQANSLCFSTGQPVSWLQWLEPLAHTATVALRTTKRRNAPQQKTDPGTPGPRRQRRASRGKGGQHSDYSPPVQRLGDATGEQGGVALVPGLLPTPLCDRGTGSMVGPLNHTPSCARRTARKAE